MQATCCCTLAACTNPGHSNQRASRCRWPTSTPRAGVQKRSLSTPACLPCRCACPHTTPHRPEHTMSRTRLAACLRNVHAYFPKALASGQGGHQLVGRTSRLPPSPAAQPNVPHAHNAEQEYDVTARGGAREDGGRWPSDLHALNLEVASCLAGTVSVLRVAEHLMRSAAMRALTTGHMIAGAA